MIIARICGVDGKLLFHGSVEILGAPAGQSYRMGGWFPVESFSFGFDEPPKEPAADPAAKGKDTPPNKKADGKDKDKSKMNIEKVVDMATTHLMLLAMRERSKKEGPKQEVVLHADIHVLGSVKFEEPAERNIFPSIIVHMEGVHVTKWEIKASGDGRPTESVTLEYDKVAMQYIWTKDGRYLEPLTQTGWDLKLQDKWGDKGEITPPFSDYVPNFS